MSNIFIEMNENFPLEDLSEMIQLYAGDKELIWVFDETQDSYIYEEHNANIKPFIFKIYEQHSKGAVISKKELDKLNSNPKLCIDFKRCAYYKTKNRDEIKNILYMDDFIITALILEKGVVTDIINYTEGDSWYVTLVYSYNESKFNKFFKEYIKRYEKDITLIRYEYETETRYVEVKCKVNEDNVEQYDFK